MTATALLKRSIKLAINTFTKYRVSKVWGLKVEMDGMDPDEGTMWIELTVKKVKGKKPIIVPALKIDQAQSTILLIGEGKFIDSYRAAQMFINQRGIKTCDLEYKGWTCVVTLTQKPEAMDMEYTLYLEHKIQNS